MMTIAHNPVSRPQRADGADDPDYQPMPSSANVLAAQKQGQVVTVADDSGIEGVGIEAFMAIGQMMINEETPLVTVTGLTVHYKSYPTSERFKFKEESEVLIQQEDIAKQYLAHYFNPLHIINLTVEKRQYHNLIYLYHDDDHYIYRNDNTVIVFSLNNAWIQEDGPEYEPISLQAATIKWQLKQQAFSGSDDYGILVDFMKHIQSTPTTLEGITHMYEDLNKSKTGFTKLKLYSVFSDDERITKEADALQVPVALRDLNFASIFSLFVASQHKEAFEQIKAVVFEIPHSVLNIFHGEFAFQMMGIYHYLKPLLKPSVTHEFKVVKNPSQGSEQSQKNDDLLDKLNDAISKKATINHDEAKVVQSNYFFNKNEELIKKYCRHLAKADTEKKKALIAEINKLESSIKSLERQRSCIIDRAEDPYSTIKEIRDLEEKLRTKTKIADIAKEQPVLFQLIKFSEEDKDSRFSEGTVSATSPPRQLFLDINEMI